MLTGTFVEGVRMSRGLKIRAEAKVKHHDEPECSVECVAADTSHLCEVAQRVSTKSQTDRVVDIHPTDVYV